MPQHSRLSPMPLKSVISGGLNESRTGSVQVARGARASRREVRGVRFRQQLSDQTQSRRA